MEEKGCRVMRWRVRAAQRALCHGWGADSVATSEEQVTSGAILGMSENIQLIRVGFLTYLFGSRVQLLWVIAGGCRPLGFVVCGPRAEISCTLNWLSWVTSWTLWTSYQGWQYCSRCQKTWESSHSDIDDLKVLISLRNAQWDYVRDILSK